MALRMLAFWLIVAWLIVSVIRGSGWTGSWDRRRSVDDVLDGRCAPGEIDEDEYRHRRELLTWNR